MTNGYQTKNKEEILNVFEKKHTLSVKEISSLLPHIDQSTIYRNIKKFITKEILKEVHTDKEEVFYEKTGDVHDHFICDDCDDIQALHIKKEYLERIVPIGCHIKNGSLTVHGNCHKCS
ncbi:MAG: Fe2+ or Zn2+ uptake regulation protein [Flavobacteriaceae bacterium]|jgi:Fe2+ or Zn2+ uptake regulation protein